MGRRKAKWVRYLACILIGCAVLCSIGVLTRPVDEVVLTIGEPYEQVRLKSRSTLPPMESAGSWAGFVDRAAQLRFDDAKFGFVTPAAKFLWVGYDKHGMVWTVSMSPQVETLPLDQAMTIVLDLQEQLRRRGWRPVKTHRFPPITQEPAMIASIRRGDDPMTFWRAADKYGASLDIRRFEDRPDDERYLITLRLSGPPFLDG